MYADIKKNFSHDYIFFSFLIYLDLFYYILINPMASLF